MNFDWLHILPGSFLFAACFASFLFASLLLLMLDCRLEKARPGYWKRGEIVAGRYMMVHPKIIEDDHIDSEYAQCPVSGELWFVHSPIECCKTIVPFVCFFFFVLFFQMSMFFLQKGVWVRPRYVCILLYK